MAQPDLLIYKLAAGVWLLHWPSFAVTVYGVELDAIVADMTDSGDSQQIDSLAVGNW